MKLIPIRSRKSRSRAVALLEVTIGLGMLVGVSLLLLKSSMSATSMQRWTVIQGMTDAYMTGETAIAKRMPYADVIASNSRWAVYPAVNEETVEIGRLPNGIPVTAVVRRTRMPDDNNFYTAGGNGTVDSNPSKMEIWRLQSLLTYTLSGREYVKSRTVVRMR